MSTLTLVKNERTQAKGIILRQARVSSLSFETFIEPENLPSLAWEPRLEFQMEIGSSGVLPSGSAETEDKHYKVGLSMQVTASVPFQTEAKNKRENETEEMKEVFSIKLVEEGIFNVRSLEEKHTQLVLHTACPEILFPYLSMRISEVVLHAGYPPPILTAYGFYRNL